MRSAGHDWRETQGGVVWSRTEAITMMRALVCFTLLLSSSSLLGGDKPKSDGYWWGSMTPGFKLGWVTGYATAMDLAGSIQMSSCASNMPLYQEKFPNVPPKEILQKMCIDDNQLDYDCVTMGQFVDGMDAFCKEFRNKQLDVGWAIQYVRD
jgi:hypothetical protein